MRHIDVSTLSSTVSHGYSCDQSQFCAYQVSDSDRSVSFYLFCHMLLLPVLVGSLRSLSRLSEYAGRPGGRRM